MMRSKERKSKGRKAYSAFLGSLTLALCLGALLTYTGTQQSDVRIWIALWIFSVGFQVMVTGQMGFENRSSEQDASQPGSDAEGPFYCGAVFEEAEDETRKGILGLVLSKELMLTRMAGLTLALGAYVYCLRKAPGFSFHGPDLIMLLGMMAILLASTLRHFILALGLNAFGVMVHQFSNLARSGSFSSTDWILLGIYVFLILFTLQLHRILDLEVNDPEADFLKRPEKQREIAWSSILCTGLVLLLTLLANWVIPQDLPKKPRISQVNMQQGALSLPKTLPAASISREDAQKVLQLLQSKMDGGSAAGAKAKEDTAELASKLELEGLIRKDLNASESGNDPQQSIQNGNAQGGQVELSKETLASMERVLQGAKNLPLQNADQNAAAADLAKALEKIQSQSQAQSQEQTLAPAPALLQGQQKQAHQQPSQPSVQRNLPKLDLEKQLKVLEKILVFVALCMAFVFLSRLFRKHVRPEDISGVQMPELSPDERSKLKKEWKSLRSGALSAREEVIACYHFFLKLMAAFGQARPDSLPPYEYASQLNSIFPIEASSIHGVTDVFCDAFYGRLEPEAPGLKKFRDQFDQICRGLI
jgi:hypothetical protein